MLGWKKPYTWDSLESAFVEARGGRDDSKEEIFAFLRSKLLVPARHRVPEAAEDIVHESLIVVHRRFSEFEALEGLLAFTHQVLRNKIGNVYQGRTRHKVQTVEETTLQYPETEEAQSVELEEILKQSIDKLGEKFPICRNILVSLYEGLEPGEISDQLGIPKSKLKVRTFRCRQALRDLLHRDYRLEL